MSSSANVLGAALDRRRLRGAGKVEGPLSPESDLDFLGHADGEPEVDNEMVERQSVHQPRSPALPGQDIRQGRCRSRRRPSATAPWLRR